MFKKNNIIAALLLFASFNIHAIPVDLELSLVIDVSGSVDNSEYNLMMDGYANAFRDATVQSNILNGTNGAISVNTIFFAGSAFTTSLDSFVLLDSMTAINDYADTLDNFIRPGSGGTAIYTGTNKAISLLDADTLYEGDGFVIDISGDGANSSASQDQAARTSAESKGYKINGITIGSASIEAYYQANVITNDGFTIHANSFGDFQAGILKKLKAETGPTPPSAPEPTTLALIALGLLGFRFSRKSVS